MQRPWVDRRTAGSNLEDDVFILIGTKKVRAAGFFSLLSSIRTLFICSSFPFGLHLRIRSCRIPLLLVGDLYEVRMNNTLKPSNRSSNLLQSVELFAIELVKLRVDVLDRILGSRDDNVLDSVDYWLSMVLDREDCS